MSIFAEQIASFDIHITPPRYNKETKTWDVKIETSDMSKIEQFNTREMARYWTKIYKYMLEY